VIARYRVHLELAAFGMLLGGAVSAAGFTDWGELHRMFTFAEPRLLLTFAGAVVLAGVGFALHCRGAGMPRRPLVRGTIPGAVVFGAGWALSGGCPGVALAQIGEGKLAALVTFGAILAGTAIGQRVKAKTGWDPGSCGA
jgi:uncharacterized membrane protein YedE/YeeE